MRTKTPLRQGGAKFRTSFRQDNVLAAHHRIATKLHCLLRRGFHQAAHMVANRPLAVLVESAWIPQRAAIRQRTKAGVEVIEPVLNQFDGNNQAAKDFAKALMRADVRPKPVAAKQHLPAKQRVPFALEIEPLRQLFQLIAARAEPFLEMLLLATALGEAKIAADEFVARHQARVRREN